MELVYKFLDVFFFAFHCVLIVFNLFGWAITRYRKFNLITLGITAFSWLALGYFYGWGYCFLTDWHWRIREQLGYANPYNSYIQFLVVQIFGFKAPEGVVNVTTAMLFAAAVVASLITNVKDHRKQKRN